MPAPDATIRDSVRAADLIVIGSVTAIGPPPPAWSGMFAAWQRVDYRVVRWLKRAEDAAPAQAISVLHPVASGAPTADPTAPRLRQSVFYPGAELILLLRRADGRLEAFDEHRGALPNEPGWLHQVTAAIGEAAAPPPPAR